MQKLLFVILLLVAIVLAEGPSQQQQYRPQHQYEPKDEKALNELRRHLIPQYDNIRDFFEVKIF
jgi:hypothetical protein